MKKMIASLLVAGLVAGAASGARAQSLQDILNTVKNGGSKSTTTNNSGAGKSTAGSGLSNTDIASGLKEALKIGAQNASNKLSATDGFFQECGIENIIASGGPASRKNTSFHRHGFCGR